MQNQTNGEVISRIKTSIKKINQDNRLITNKYIYSLLNKWRNLHISRLDSKSGVMLFSYIFQTLPEEDLIYVDKVASKCSAIKSHIYIKRTKRVLPTLVNGFNGPIIKNVSSIDGDIILTPTTRQAFIKKANSKDYKYNKELYYWFEEGYLWFPNIEWDAVMIQGFFDEDIDKYVCVDCKHAPDQCKSRLDQQFRAPAKLIPDIEIGLMNDVKVFLGIPTDEVINKNSNQ